MPITETGIEGTEIGIEKDAPARVIGEGAAEQAHEIEEVEEEEATEIEIEIGECRDFTVHDPSVS